MCRQFPVCYLFDTMQIPARMIQFGASQVRAKHVKVKLLPPCPPSYNDLPEPLGDWDSHYKAKQMKYNLQLGASVLFLFGTIALAKTCGFLKLNYSPPEKPGAREC